MYNTQNYMHTHKKSHVYNHYKNHNPYFCESPNKFQRAFLTQHLKSYETIKGVLNVIAFHFTNFKQNCEP